MAKPIQYCKVKNNIITLKIKKIRNKKWRHYFANKGPSSQSYGFYVVMYGSESWTIKKAEH